MEGVNKTLSEAAKLSVEDLRSLVESYYLASDGTKRILMKRLKEHLLGEVCEESETDTESVKTDGTAVETQSKVNIINPNESSSSRNGIEGNFSVRDIDQTVQSFSGDDNLTISRWFREFEDMAAIFGWNDVQMLIYAKRLLKGSAKDFVNSLHGIRSWPTLKIRLFEEFHEQKSTAEIHSIMMKRKKLPTESYKQYLYAMQEIGSNINMDQSSIIHYVIQGIPGDEVSKMVLHGASNLKEFKVKLGCYEKLIASRELGTNYRYPENSGSNGFEKERDKRRGDEKDRRARGKCWKCGIRGHYAAKCSKKDESNSDNIKSNDKDQKTHTNTIRDKNNFCKVISMNNKNFEALIDTGSSLNIIVDDVYVAIGRPKLNPTCKTLVGLGGKEIVPRGFVESEIQIDSHTFSSNFYVIPGSASQVKIIIGQELLANAVLEVRPDNVKISGWVPQCEEMTNNVTHEIMNISYVEDNDWEGELKASEKAEIKKLVENYNPKKNVETPIETKIILTDETPVYSSPRRLAPKERAELEKQVNEWISTNIIVPSVSDFASPVVMVRKKDGSMRVCIDYRRLNKKIVKDRFPMALIEDKLDQLSGASIFSTLDLRNGFFHVPVAAESRKFTAFVTPWGQYEFLRTPFGLCNSPASFQRFINYVFKDLLANKIVVLYMDDLIVPSKDKLEGMERLKCVLNTAECNGLEINWKKCKFLQRRVEFLGHMIEDGKVQPSPDKVLAVKSFPEPSNVKQVQSFLGLSGFFRKFIPKYSIIAKPLTDLLQKGSTFQFGADQRQAVAHLKASLSANPVLRIFDPDSVTELHTDASVDGFGAVLLQRRAHEKDFHPVYYMSKKTSPAERNYSSFELEVLAVVNAVTKFRVYLLGTRFKLVTDCDAFVKTLKRKELSPKIARWAILLEEFEYTVEHRAGTKMKHVDALSRNPVMVIESILTKLIKDRQDSDDAIKAIKTILQTQQDYDGYVLVNNVLFKQVKGENLIVVPEVLQMELIRKIHENGHIGSKKMESIIIREFFIKNLHDKITRCINSCIPCILAERKRGKKEGFLNPVEKGDMPLCVYHVDHLGPMTATGKQYKYIFSVIDGFSKFVWLYPTKSTNTAEVLNKLKIQQAVFGNPEVIVSDRGTAFTSQAFKEYCEVENIRHHLITTGVPRSNGQIERIHQIIIPMLKKLSEENPDHWYKHVEKVQRVLNSTYQRSVNSSPFEVLMGVKMRQKEDLKLLETLQEEIVAEFGRNRDDLRARAKTQIGKVQEEMKKTYNLKRKRANLFSINDIVAIKRTQFRTGNKLNSSFLGPYKVISSDGRDRYSLERIGNSEGPKKTTSVAEYMKPWPVHSNGSFE